MNLATLLKLASTRLDAERGGMSTSNLAYAEVDSEGHLVVVNPLAKMKWGWQTGSHVQGEMQIALEGLAGTQPTELPLKLGGLHIGAIVRGENGGWQVFGYDPDQSQSLIKQSPLRSAIVEPSDLAELSLDRSAESLQQSALELETGTARDIVHDVTLKTETIPTLDQSKTQESSMSGPEKLGLRRIRHRMRPLYTDATDQQLASGLQTLRLLATTSPDHAVFCDSAMQTIATALSAESVLFIVRDGSGHLSPASQSHAILDAELEEFKISANHPLLELVESHGAAMSINRSIAPTICSQLGCESALVAAVKDNGQTLGYVFVIPAPDSPTDRSIDEMLKRPVDRLVHCFESLYSWITVISRYRGLISSMEESVFSFHVDVNGCRHYSSFSDRIEKISGYRPSELTSGRPDQLSWIDDVVFEGDRDTVRAGTQEISTGHPHVIEYRIVHRNGSVRWVRERSWNSTDAIGLRSIQGTLSDISEQKAFEVMATDAHEHAGASRRSKTAFIATMSHEVRTPVGALSGYAQLLQKELVDFEQTSGTALPEPIHEFANVLTGRSHKLQTLVHDLFELSNLEMGSITLLHERVCIHDIIQKCASKESPRLQRKGVTLTFDLAEENPAVLTDPYCMEQVFKNVLSNATKFTEKGSVSIRTRVADSTVVVEIEDTGVGISDEFQNSLFEPYSQEENWRTRKFGGTGLGLALSRRLLEKFGGRIEVESEKGKGSTFRILMPIHQD